MKKIEWKAPEYIYKEKTADWYWIVGIVSVSVAIISVILNNPIFGLLIIISAFTLSLYATRRPEIVTIKINELGVRIGRTDYPYSELESFWVEDRDAYPRVFFKSQKKLSLFIIAMIEGTDPEEIRDVLNDYLPETEHSEPFLEKVLIYLGF